MRMSSALSKISFHVLSIWTVDFVVNFTIGSMVLHIIFGSNLMDHLWQNLLFVNILIILKTILFYDYIYWLKNMCWICTEPVKKSQYIFLTPWEIIL